MITFLTKNHIPYKEYIPLSNFTGMNQIGILPLIVYPETIEQLKSIYLKAITDKLSFDILGGITNTYLSNNYQRDIIIVTTKLKGIEKTNETIWVECGYSLTKIAWELSSEGITGYEGFIGIPGTIGAAAINNSGAFNTSISNIVKKVKILTPQGNVTDLTNKELKYTNRNSILKRNLGKGIVLYVELNTTNKDNVDNILNRIKIYNAFRKTQVDGLSKNKKSRNVLILVLWKKNLIGWLITFFVKIAILCRLPISLRLLDTKILPRLFRLPSTCVLRKAL